MLISGSTRKMKLIRKVTKSCVSTLLSSGHQLGTNFDTGHKAGYLDLLT
jgi:hypothetical protein